MFIYIYIYWFVNYNADRIKGVIDLNNDFSTVTLVILYVGLPMLIITFLSYEIIKAAITGQLFQKKANETDRGKDDNKKS